MGKDLNASSFTLFVKVNMKMKLSILLSVLVLVAAAGFAVFTILNFTGYFSSHQVLGGYSQVSGTGSSVGLNIGDKAPDFTVTTSDGKTLSLSDFTNQKKPVIVYFWATWCPFCRDEFETLDSIYPQYKGRVELIAVDLDTGETLQQIQNYKDQHAHDWTFTNGNIDVLRDYNVRATTTKYIIDQNGIIVTKGVGVISADKWQTAFKTALGEV